MINEDGFTNRGFVMVVLAIIGIVLFILCSGCTVTGNSLALVAINYRGNQSGFSNGQGYTSEGGGKASFPLGPLGAADGPMATGFDTNRTTSAVGGTNAIWRATR